MSGMSAAGRPERTSGVEGSNGRSSTGPVSPGMSPYATGGSGVTFERRWRFVNSPRLLLDDGAGELGDGRRVLSVAFQRLPEHQVEDLGLLCVRRHIGRWG